MRDSIYSISETQEIEMPDTYLASTVSDRDKLHEALNAVTVALQHIRVITDEVASEHAKNAIREVVEVMQGAEEAATAEIRAALYDLGEA